MDMPGFVEVCRSFGYKLALPNYENRDFFCSAKKQVPEADMEEASEKLYKFCALQVMADVRDYCQQNGLRVPTSK